MAQGGLGGQSERRGRETCAERVEFRARHGSSRYVVALATAADDADLRRLLHETPMPGPIQLSFEREPNFFAAVRAEGGRHYTAVIRDRHTGELAVMGSRVVHQLFVNGQPQWVGYLSQLRIAPGHRRCGRQILRLGFDLLRETHAADEAPFDITTIVAGNETARRLLEAGLPGLPHYTPVGKILTMLLPGRAVVADRRFSERNQFAPVEPLPAVWDQRAFKQVVVRGYSPWLRRCRWLLGLPPVGSVLPVAYLAGPAAAVPDCRWLVLGLSDRHPLVPELRRRYRPRVYESTLYVVHEPGTTVELDGRIPHVEVALL